MLSLEKEPLLDRCHRTLRERPQEDQPPHRLCGEISLLPGEGNDPPQPCPQIRQRHTEIGSEYYYTQAVAKQRAAFRDVKGMLRGCDGVKYGLWYPSVLRITTPDGKRHSFTDPGEAKDFVLRNVAKQSS
ncbi:hypothetical protein CesoFtcFv8_024712 [Champsocephalus esox]|uniref:Uncharacterized protein n=1 Tax=Champsocephalus esox TaxID=159716 RepID=A0AAN8B6C2_9TELE|nr:hypothetical protein CesoFtcFv8_024712 [Champsocephalus esox]